MAQHAHKPDGVAYPLYFRENVMDLINAGGSYRAIANVMHCHAKTVWRINQKYQRTGDPSAVAPPGYRLKMLSAAEAAVIGRLKLMMPSISGIEVQRMLQLMCNKSPSLATISRELKRMDFSFRRMRFISVNRDPVQRMRHYTQPPPVGTAGSNGRRLVNVRVRRFLLVSLLALSLSFSFSVCVCVSVSVSVSSVQHHIMASWQQGRNTPRDSFVRVQQ
eukprot:m.333897 g.333897  ORF g.333897 m.333897 type:complete len:219 (-) comp27745_c2_seq1:168-824(-)